MSLIKCKYCGEKISDKAIRCPHCNKDLNVNLTENEQNGKETTTSQLTSAEDNTLNKNIASDTSQDKEIEKRAQHGYKKNVYVVYISISILVIIAVLSFLYFDYTRQAEVLRNRSNTERDSLIIMQKELSNINALNQDSITKVDRVTKSSALFELKGPVKSVRFFSNPIILGLGEKFVFKFNRNGEWNNMNEFKEQVLKLYNNHISISDIEKNASYRISLDGWHYSYYFNDGTGFEIDNNKIWRNNRVVKSEIIESETFDNGNKEINFYYDSDKPFLSSIEVKGYTNVYEPDLGNNLKIKYTYNEYDKYGNWVSRSIVVPEFIIYEIYGHNTYNKYMETDRKYKVIEEREIIYYDL